MNVSINDMQTMMYVLIGYSVFLSVLLLLVFLITPAWTWLYAKIRGRPIWGVLNKSNSIKFNVAPVESDSVKIKKVGYFFLEPTAIVSWPNGVRGGLVISDKAIMPSPRLVKSATRLSEAGIEDISEAEKIEYLLTLEKNEEDISPKALKKNYENISSEYIEIARKLENRERHDKYNSEMVNLHVLKNFFKYSHTPMGIHKVVENKQANYAEKYGRPGFHVSMDHIMAVMMIAIIAAIVYYILRAGDAGSAVSGVVNQATTAAQNVGNQVTGGIGIK